MLSEAKILAFIIKKVKIREKDIKNLASFDLNLYLCIENKY